MILICPRCEDNDVISPLEAGVDAKYATCPREGCDYKMLVDMNIIVIGDQTITTASSKETLRDE